MFPLIKIIIIYLKTIHIKKCFPFNFHPVKILFKITFASNESCIYLLRLKNKTIFSRKKIRARKIIKSKVLDQLIFK